MRQSTVVSLLLRPPPLQASSYRTARDTDKDESWLDGDDDN